MNNPKNIADILKVDDIKGLLLDHLELAESLQSITLIAFDDQDRLRVFYCGTLPEAMGMVELAKTALLNDLEGQ